MFLCLKKHVLMSKLEIHYGVYWSIQLVSIAGAAVGRVALEVGVVVQSTLVDGEELMTGNPRIIRALQLRVDTYFRIADGLLQATAVVGTTEGSVLLQLLQTTTVVEPSPTDEVEATAELTAKLLRTLHVRNLLEQLVGTVEIRELQVSQTSAVTHLVDPVDGLLCRTADLVLALCSAQQHV